ncbi:hypothetical protein [Allobaculum sp. Allo2]|uniref:hypothetical protein n=1 Tax=Allobaculum sp. Allo2 TaxID=2853432 RepID=UPI001F60989E|nr:hypothetical protein [Allobaculum sp. Allo2]UNT92680.1 hypothetical protein KWG61_11215 [Allobaculum sp. Allo2]
MIYVTGDTHGRKNKWTEQIEPVLHDGDTVIVCGDFGVGFWAEDREGKKPFTIIWPVRTIQFFFSMEIMKTLISSMTIRRKCGMTETFTSSETTFFI